MNEPIRPEDMRASDVDRKAAQERLHWAHEQGLLDLGEFDDRVRRAWAAKTHGELARINADLPTPPKPRTPAKGPFSNTGAGVAMRVLTIIFSAIGAVNLMVWLLVVLTNGEWIYFWPAWVIVPPLTVLGTLWLLGIGRNDQRGKG